MATVLWAQKLKDAGVKIYTIGIGNQTDRTELQGIASDNNHVFMVDSFADLLSIHSLVLRVYCEGKYIIMNYVNLYEICWSAGTLTVNLYELNEYYF
jgi:hypothetical protein